LKKIGKVEISPGAIPAAFSRYYMTLRLAQWLGSPFPLGTFLINLFGALLMEGWPPFLSDSGLRPRIQLAVLTHQSAHLF
jgi:fluoride ion exporter CrcB/FEX